MNEVISDFIHNVFQPRYIENICKAFSLFEAFEHQDAYGGMMDAINDESISTLEARADHFNVELANQLDYIVKQHAIQLHPDATIADRILILDALFRVQHLEDYTAITSILSTFEEPVDKLCKILEELTSQDEAVFLKIIEAVEKNTLDLLHDYIEMKTEDLPAHPVDQSIVARVKLVTQVIGKETIGYSMVEAGMRLGYPFHLYLPYVKSQLVDLDHQKTARNFLSVLAMTDIKDNDIITVYRAVSEPLVPDLNQASKIESELLKSLAGVEEQRKIQHESTRVP